MCLSIPAIVKEIDGDQAKVSIGGSLLDINISLLAQVSVGDYVLVHTGFALEIIDEQEAIQALDRLKQLKAEL